MISWNTHETRDHEDELDLPPPPPMPKEHRHTKPLRRNPDWTETAPNEWYCTKHHFVWRDGRGCYACAEEKDVSALRGTSSFAEQARTGAAAPLTTNGIGYTYNGMGSGGGGGGPPAPKEVRITDPNTGGQKGQKEERFDLIPWDAMEELARVYGRGAKKYDDHNWLKGYKWSLSLGALARHLARIMVGEDRDPESGCLHSAHIAWHALTITTYMMRKLGTDDRAAP